MLQRVWKRKRGGFFTVKENTLDIVTNPPYFCADKFLKHALEISVPKVKIAMLFRLAFLEGQKRYELFKKISYKKGICIFQKT